MKVMVTGSHGQLGRALVRTATGRGHDIVAVDRDTLDVRDSVACANAIASEAPRVLINAAAYTSVDRAEMERDEAFAINAAGAENLARACEQYGAMLVHVSTDYVFPGTGLRPYRETDPVEPLGVYGASKAAGEQAVLARHGRVVRTSWLFGEGGPSFVHTILRLAAEREALRIVGDQRGCPTYTGDLANALLDIAERQLEPGIYHYCSEPASTWHAFATVIVDEARRHRSLACRRIDEITTAEYPTPAKRPAYSVLDTSKLRAHGIVPPAWHAGLVRVVAREYS
jgi:dTDP-4-dehydrorhamnose reductase